LVCSTEFFVLRSIDGRSISFLIPLLLSGPVQAILSAAQEGGHHPRFNESTLLDLRVPKALLEQREQISTEIEFAACLYRDSESKMLAGIQTAEVGFLALKDSEQTSDASRSSLGAP
jgi:restriction endonuclease S subunit